MIHVVMPRQRYRGESQGPWHAWVKFAQCSAAQSAGGIGCAGSDAMHSLACSNNVIIVPCSHLPLTAKRDSDSGEERQRRLTINAASSLLAWHPRLTQPHSLARATTTKKKAGQRSWASIIMARRLADGGWLCAAAILTVAAAPTMCASIRTPLYLLP